MHLAHALLLIVALLTPATATPAPEASPWADAFVEARAATDTPFQLAILADDVITAQENDLAVHAFLTCMADAGYPNTLERDGLLPWVPWYSQMSMDDLNATPQATPITMTEDDWFATTDQAYSDCSTEWKTQVEMLYHAMIVNPDNRDWAEITYDCAVRKDLLPDGYMREQFLAAYRGEAEWGDDVEIFSDDFAYCVADPLDVRLTADIPYPGDPLTPVPNPAWEADIESTRQDIDSPFQLRILEDNVVDDLEYALADQAFLGCMADRGYDVELEYDGFIPGSTSYTYVFPDATPQASPVADEVLYANYDQAFVECGRLWNFYAPPLRDAMLTNPDNVDILTLNLPCLQDNNLVPDDFGMADLQHAAETGDWGPDVDPSTWEFARCLINPLGVGLDDQATPIP